jgi:hypothetical protein
MSMEPLIMKLQGYEIIEYIVNFHNIRQSAGR